MALSDLNSSELSAVSATLNNADKLGNTGDVEISWAMKAMDHATVHYNLISSLDAKTLRLTKIDDKIYEDFRKKFPDLNVALIVEDDLKTPEAKEAWRNFCESFKGEVEDYNLGTLLRLDCEKDYTPDNTTFSVRTQFLAIEIARNKEGFNSPLSLKKRGAEEKKS